MRNHWTRDGIIRHLLQREAQGQSLTVGGDGVDKSLYEAARRIFGSWQNAVHAAGIPAERALTWERWQPGRVLVVIRHLAKRKRPLSVKELERRYGNMVATARRHYGSWTKAVLAAGVDPGRLRRVVPWTRERVIEAILTRALRNQSLVIRAIEPRSLVDAGQRYFGGWSAAVAAAGLDPTLASPHPRETPPAIGKTPLARPGQRRWTKELVIAGIQARWREGKPLHPSGLAREDRSLYHAARRHLGSWEMAMRAASIDPAEHRCVPVSAVRNALCWHVELGTAGTQDRPAPRPEPSAESGEAKDRSGDDR